MMSSAVVAASASMQDACFGVSEREMHRAMASDIINSLLSSHARFPYNAADVEMLKHTTTCLSLSTSNSANFDQECVPVQSNAERKTKA